MPKKNVKTLQRKENSNESNILQEPLASLQRFLAKRAYGKGSDLRTWPRKRKWGKRHYLNHVENQFNRDASHMIAGDIY